MWYHWILCDIITHIIHCSIAPSQGQLPGPPASPCSQGCPRPPVPPAPQYWDLSAGQSAHPVGVWGMKAIKKNGASQYSSYTSQVYGVIPPWLYESSIRSYARYTSLLSKSSILIRVLCIFFLIFQLRVNKLLTNDITWYWYSLHIPSPSLQWQRNWWTGRQWNTPCWCWWCKTSCLASQSAHRHVWWV